MDKQLNNTLRTEARRLGLCDEWYDAWDKNETQLELINKYIRGIDFCIKHDYPKIEYIRENFSKEILNGCGVFVDDTVDVINAEKVVLLGDCKGLLVFNTQISSDVYVRHQSEIEIIAEGGAKVFVETYEQCSLKVCADRLSKVFVYKHGGNIEVSGNVVVRNKTNTLS